jgi:3-dehydroquinate synthase
MLEAPSAERLRRLLERAGLPVAGPPLDADRYLELMSVDKKAQGGRLRFILLERLGAAVIRSDVAPDALRATLASAVTA